MVKIFKQYDFKNYKWLLAISVIVLSIIGIFIVGSAKESVQERQIFGVIIGVISMLIISMIDYKWILKLSWLIYIGAIGLLIAVLLFGKNINGATRWIDLKITRFQPSELVKIFLIIFFAYYFTKYKDKINTFQVIISALGLIAIPVLLIINQPDLSTTLSIVAVFAILFYLAGISYKIIGIVILIAVPTVAALLFYVVQPNQILLKGYQQNRVLAWLNPEEYADDEAYQQINSQIAIGSGQLVGKGLNNNTTTSVKNGNFILEPQTDFVFAIIGEELGFRGACFIIIFLFFIIMQCIIIGIRASLDEGKLICYGIAAQIGVQAYINIGVATGILPNTGIPLPFVSYGLTSLVSMFAGIGLVLNIGLQQKK